MTEPIPQDTPMNYRSMDQIPLDEMKQKLAGIRERRMALKRAYEEALTLKLEKKNHTNWKKIDKHVNILTKELERADIIITKIEERVKKIDVIRIELVDIMEV